eukprot:gene22179-29241_t
MRDMRGDEVLAQGQGPTLLSLLGRCQEAVPALAIVTSASVRLVKPDIPSNGAQAGRRSPALHIAVCVLQLATTLSPLQTSLQMVLSLVDALLLSIEPSTSLQMAPRLVNALLLSITVCVLQQRGVSSLQATCDNTCHFMNIGSLDSTLAYVEGANANGSLATHPGTHADLHEFSLTPEDKACSRHYSQYYNAYYTELYSEHFSHIFSEYYGKLCNSDINYKNSEYCRQYTRIMQDGEHYTQYYAKYFSEYMSNYFGSHFSEYCGLPKTPSTASCPSPNSSTSELSSTCSSGL